MRRHELSKELLTNTKAALPKLEKLLEECNGHWAGEDLIYRYYHQSFKVYGIQHYTKSIVDELKALLPGRELSARFMFIYNRGTGKQFQAEHNSRWAEETLPMVEAFFHARHFLTMAVTYAKMLDAAPEVLPSGWATFLYLYSLR